MNKNPKKVVLNLLKINTMPNQECLGIQDTTTGLWLISINSDGSYSWGNASDAICFPSDAARDAVLAELNSGGSDRFIGHVPPKPHH